MSRQDSGKKFVLLVLNGLTVDDISRNGLRDITDNAAVGLLNIRTKKKADSNTAGYLSIGAGAKAETGEDQLDIFNIGESINNLSVRDIFKTRIGKMPNQFDKKNNSDVITVLDWANIIKIHESFEQSAIPGILGDTLKKNRISYKVLGNSDFIDIKQQRINYQRNIALIAVDNDGLAYGNVSEELNTIDSSSPGGYKVNNELFIRKVDENILKNDVLFVEWGDFSRFNNDIRFMTEEKLKENENKVRNDSAKFIKDVIDIVKKRVKDYRILIVNPTHPNRIEDINLSLTPAILIGNNVNRNSMLTAGSTRRPGIITNRDIAPTILDFYGVKNTVDFEGSVIKNIEKKGSKEEIIKLNKRIIDIHIARKIILTIYAFLIITVLVIGTLTLSYLKKGKDDKMNILKVMTFLSFFILVMPIVFLIIPVLSNIYSTSILFLISGLVISSVVLLISKDNLTRLLTILIATYVTTVIDAITGQNLIKYSVLSYDPITGGRFYGIGNEYMGVLLGCTIMIAAIVLQKTRLAELKLNKISIPFIFVLTTIVIGYPALGANMGGLISAVIGFSYASYKLLINKKVGIKQVGMIIATMLLVVLAIVFADTLSKSGYSHAARAIFKIKGGGYYEVIKIIIIKTLLNIRLIYFSSWTIVIVSMIAVFLILLVKPYESMSAAREKYPLFMTGINAVAFSALVAFIFNDTGVGVASIILIFALIPLMLVVNSNEVKQ